MTAAGEVQSPRSTVQGRQLCTLDRPASRVPRPWTGTSRPEPLFHLILLALSTAVLVLAAVLSVRSGTQVLLPMIDLPLPELCTMRRLTGLNCPGCGLTRSFISLA